MTGSGSVRISRMLNIDQCPVRNALDLGVNQELHHLPKADRRRPSGGATQLAVVADQRRAWLADDGRLDLDVLPPVDAGPAEGDPDALLDAVCLPGGDD